MATVRKRSGKQITNENSHNGSGVVAKRPPESGGWKFVTPEEIRAFRKERGMSRAKLAEALGVSTTSIQNWESGRVAARATQRKLRSLLDGEPLEAPGSAAQDSIVTVTGQIVAAYVATQPTLDPDDVTRLIRDVKAALSE